MYKVPHNSTIFEKGPTYAGARLYNKLPNNLKQQDTARSFKLELANFLVDKEFYDVEDFLNM